MPTLTREELWRDLKAGKVGPLYLLFGPEDYLRDAAARAVADAALKGAPLREFAELKDAELAAWARDRLKHLGAQAEERALRQTVALAGPSVRRVATELEKLATAALPGGPATV